MTTNGVTTMPEAVLGLPPPGKLVLPFAKGILVALTNNLNFVTPTPPLAVYSAHIDAFDKAEVTAASRAKGSAGQRNAKRKAVIDDLYHYLDYVQGISELQTSPEDAAAVILSAGMRIRQVGKRAKPAFAATNTGVSGMVRLTALRVARLATYYWQYSLDQKVWVDAHDTMKATTVISGLTPAQTYYFRFRALTPKKSVDFSQVVSLLVH